MPAQSAVLTRPGQFESLRFEDHPSPTMASHQVEIEVEAAALNFKDVLLALGLMPSNSSNFGFECAGVIRGVGSQVSGFVPGDAVVAIGGGCLSTHVSVDAR